MRSEAEGSKSRAGRAGPQGTQVYSRDEIASLLEEGDSQLGPTQASLVLLSREQEAEDDEDRAGSVFPLARDRVTIGRSRICDVCIQEPSMSSEHARLVRSDGAWRVINLLSTNGVFVNGEKVFSHRLSDGDEIRLGRTVLRFRDPQDGSGSASGPGWMAWAGAAVGALGLALLLYWLLG